MEKVSGYTQWKVIGGYIILSLLSLLFAILIYKQITKLITDEGTASNPNQKLFLVGNITTGLYEAEALSNAFIQTGSQSYFKKYVDIMEQADFDIDSLRNLTFRLEQQIRIDSISILLEEKVKNLKELAWVKRRFVPDDLYSKTMANIESEKEYPEHLNTRKRLVATLDTSYIKTENKKRRWLFFKAKPDSVIRVSSTIRTIVDTLPGCMATQTADSVINILKSTWEDIQKQTQNFNRQISRREYALILQSTDITDQLKRTLSDYEKEELTLSLNKQQNREQTVNTVLHIFAWVAVIALLLVIFFTFFILRDLSRSQRYRRDLESANRYAGQLLKSREKMILTVTHDIKSPLSSILGYIELLYSTSTTERQRYFLKNMKGSSEHILKLVTNLLDLSKLENNRLTVEEIVFNPAHLFNEIKDNFIPLALAKQLNLESKFGEDLDGEYKGDALRIRQIITNILSNAIKYTSTGKISFTATGSTENKKIIIRIKDTGSGMTPEEQKIIFEEFTRLTSHSAIEGTGLGLTITLKLIHLLNGEIKLESDPGKGSCFTIILPLEKSIGNATGSVEIVESIIPPATTAGKFKALLVDDDPLQLEMTVNLLASKGLQADSTTHPQEVIEKLNEGHYDLVFSDIQMPEMNGFELIKQIRSLPEPVAKIPVIALSGDSDKEEKEYVQAGFTAHLAKPFNSGQIIALINRILHAGIQEDIQVTPNKGVIETKDYTLDNILKFADNDREALHSIITSFRTATREHLDLLKQFVQEEQGESIARLAHKMLPMFRQLEAQEIIAILQKLEHPDKDNLSITDITTQTQEAIIRIENLLHSME